MRILRCYRTNHMDMCTATGAPQWRAGVNTQLRAIVRTSPRLLEGETCSSPSRHPGIDYRSGVGDVELHLHGAGVRLVQRRWPVLGAVEELRRLVDVPDPEGTVDGVRGKSSPGTGKVAKFLVG